MQEVLVGLDVGTTRCKAIAVSLNGTVVASASSEYSITSPQPGWAEQDPVRVWRTALSVLRNVCQSIPNVAVLGLGLSVQGEAVIPLNKQGKPLRPAILGMDVRTEEENNLLQKYFGDRLFEITGMPIHTVNTLPKLLWIKIHEPDIWAKTWRFVLYEDFLTYRLTGTPAISQCLASRTQLYNISQNHWDFDILQFLELTKNKLSNLAPSGTSIGKIKKDIQRILRLKTRPEVVLGGHDQACAAFGAGVTEPGSGLISTGSAEVILIVIDRAYTINEMSKANISCYLHVIPERYLLMTLNHCGGIILQWFRDNFCVDEVKRAKRLKRDAYELILANLPFAPSGILLFPHFAGSGSPAPDPQSQAGVLGIGLWTTRKHFIKALIEGLCYELRLNVDFINKIGFSCNSFTTVGGGAKSAVWNQIKADVLGLPIKLPLYLDSAPLGAAFLAGIGTGVFSSYTQIHNWIKIEREYIPSETNKKIYNMFYEQYKNIRPLIVSLTKHLKFVE
ncbi:MAG: FGGY-family carbohydrate kinase [Candidatus Bathyarchaeia archaeon]